MLLQYDKVTPCVSPGVVREGIVGQSYSRYKVRSLHQFHTHERRCGIHHTLRCNKGYQTALTDGVHCFEEELIVDSLCRLTVGNLLARGKLGVCDCEISERNIGAGYIEIAVVIRFNFLKPRNFGSY